MQERVFSYPPWGVLVHPIGTSDVQFNLGCAKGRDPEVKHPQQSQTPRKEQIDESVNFNTYEPNRSFRF
jgi:hypothetical protein